MGRAKTVAILQSNYIPWKGYFDIMRSVDEFVLLDDVQYTRHDWRNRNLIKTPEGTTFLTIPVITKGLPEQKINECRVTDDNWRSRHWDAIRENYQDAPFFGTYAPQLEALYLSDREKNLSRINFSFLSGLCGMLDIATPLTWSTQYPTATEKTERLIAICQAAGATRYLSGPSAKAYINETRMQEAGIAVTYVNYGGYPVYPQLHGAFQHCVSVIDLILNTGPAATQHMKRF
jgi:hypothetical protein